MNLEVLEIAGLRSTLKALRLPFGRDCRSFTHFKCISKGDYTSFLSSVEMNPNDLKLMSTLVKRGDEHAKAIRGIVVWMEIEAPVYWWCEMETYRAGHERLSSESTMHIDCKGLSGEELVKAKSEIPMGKMLKKVDYFSYQSLRTIYKQRKDHRLPEWKQFLDAIECLPYAEDLILCGLK